MLLGDFGVLVKALVWIREHSPLYAERIPAVSELGVFVESDPHDRRTLPRFANETARVVEAE